MRPSRIRSLLLAAVLLGLCGGAWLYLAPTQIGGSTRYMITHGTSMEPSFHSGDLVLVRPADSYKVGQIVAYRSSLLHTVVLHRIIGIRDGRYIFKGDNNGFVDPTHPTRALLVGRMWLHIPRAGAVLAWVHKPWAAAVLTGGVAMLLLVGEGSGRRRRRRGHAAGASQRRLRGPDPVTNRYLLTVSGSVAALFAALSVFAFLRPAVSSSVAAIPYTQTVSFGYHGHVRPGPVYPTGVVSTGDPLYAQLLHRLTVTATYQLTAASPHHLGGSVRIRGRLSNTSGWSRTLWLGPSAQIVDGRAVASARILLSQLESLTNRVTSLIGPGAGTYTLEVSPQLKLVGEVAGQPLASTTQPSLKLALGGGQLLSGNSPTAGLVNTTTGKVLSTRSSVDKLAGVPIKTVRLIGLGGLTVFTLLAVLLAMRGRDSAADPSERINRRYGHLIVPVSSVTTDPERAPIEVRTMQALVQLAQRSERLILHHRDNGSDSYLVEDQGTLFRYRPPAGDAGTAVVAADTPSAETQPNTGGAERGVATASEEPAEATGSAADTVELTASRGPGRPSDSHQHSLDDGDGFDLQAGPAITAAAIGGTSTVADSPAASRPASAGRDDPGDARPASERARSQGDFDRTPGSRPGAAAHWSRRPQARAGLALGPLALAVFMWRRLRRRRLTKRQAELDARWSASRDRRRRDEPPARQRARGDRRGGGDRRRND